MLILKYNAEWKAQVNLPTLIFHIKYNGITTYVWLSFFKHAINLYLILANLYLEY